MNIYKQIFISGCVQGVFFRDSTCQKANALNLSGAVRNLCDGRVEVQVSGNIADIQRLIKWLKIGPKYAKVSNIEVAEAENFDMLPVVEDASQSIQQYRRFVVRPTK